jgi:ethanolaminephosphotransferase
VSLTIPLVTAAFIFKVSCEQELSHTVALPFVVDRTSLFRTVRVLVALATLVVCILGAREGALEDTSLLFQHSTLSERLHHLLTLFLITQSRAENVPLFLVLEQQQMALQTLLQHGTFAHPDAIPPRRTKSGDDASAIDVAISVLVFSHTSFFCFGGSNSISSIDLSNAYNGISVYDVATVGMLLFSSNWTGPIWWCSVACDLVPRDQPLSAQQQVTSGRGHHQSADETQRRPRANDKHGEPTEDRSSMPWLTYLLTLSAFMASGVLIVMVLCTVRREDSTVWKIWGSKYLYSVFWVLEWHLIVSLGLSSILRALGRLGWSIHGQAIEAGIDAV